MGTEASETPAMPKLVAFDLDYTLWPLWVDTHVFGTLTRPNDALNLVRDRSGTKLSFYPDVAGILFQLKREGIHVAACSRTHAPETAREALNGLFIVDESSTSKKKGKAPADPAEAVAAMTLFDSLEIYPGTKIPHFESLRRKTGLPHSEMLFFDDESRNSEVERKLGVKFCLVKNGLDRRTFEQGLQDWRKAQSRA